MKKVPCTLITMLLFLTITTRAEWVPQDNSRENSEKQEIKESKKTKHKHDSFIQCMPSTVVSSVAGVFTGTLNRYLEKECQIDKSKEFIIWLMLGWWLEHKARHSIIGRLAEDFAESDVPFRKNFMYFSAWISSWLAYLHG